MSFSKDTVDAVQVIGIIASLLLASVGFLVAAYETRRSSASRRLQNYHEIIRSHREIWTLTLDKRSEYARILDPNADLAREPLTYPERRFINLLLLHMTSAYYLSRSHEIIPIQETKRDFDELLALPLPRAVWQAQRRYFNADFVAFVESSPRARPVPTESGPIINLAYATRWNILVMTAFPERFVRSLSRFDDRLLFGRSDLEITPEFVEDNEVNLILLFGHSTLLTTDVLDAVTAINTHGALLPHDRGPNPNLWSIINRGPRGVTIHYVDSGVNTGDIIAQKELGSPTETTSVQAAFDHLVDQGVALFDETWPLIRSGRAERRPQVEGGSHHSLVDQVPLATLLTPEGLSLPIGAFRERALHLLGQS